ncbi:Hpt domain-containing protein [Enterobacter sp. R4-368]|uniref:Hpt domain-containing protein n=1 Tax=Enterobacter sp. R4-368 TaxID=1166130 RepID=UPI00034EE0D7|nr:Hpt domain-containing protein [Enterobacter sp. R4-368]AGN87409.1 hypothetical protein H650_20500 [Enterobacter sp. R4-368]
MHGMQALLATYSAEQQRTLAQQLRFCSDLNIATVNISDAHDALSRHVWHALLVDLSENANSGVALVEKLLAAELAGELTLPPLLLACTDDEQAETESMLRLKGFDHILYFPLSEARLRCASQSRDMAQPELHELHKLANHQQPVIDAMLPKLLQALASDIQQLEIIARAGTLLQIARLAHRMKSSWYLLGMRRAIRCCIVMEQLPKLINEGVINQGSISKMRQRFISLMFKDYKQLVLLFG